MLSPAELESRLIEMGFVEGASVEIRKNIDTFIDDLWRAAYWNSWAAVTACAAAVASGVVALCEVFR